MSLSIDEIRQRTSRARDLMRRSRLEGFAVGAFNIDNQETLRAICQAARTWPGSVSGISGRADSAARS